MDQAGRRNRTRCSAADDVYDQLRSEILSLRIHPGEALSENAMADRFGVSRTPVRSVFLRLAKDGLLDMRGRRGTFVSLIDLDLAEQITFMRIQVELAAMAFISRHPDRRLLSRLRGNVERQRRLVAAGAEGDEYYRVDSLFHGMCMENVHKLSLWNMIQGMDVHYSRYRRLDYIAARNGEVFGTLLAEHEEFTRHMAEGRTRELRHKLTSHLYGGFLRIGMRLATEYRSFFVDSNRSLRRILADVKSAIGETL